MLMITQQMSLMAENSVLQQCLSERVLVLSIYYQIIYSNLTSELTPSMVLKHVIHIADNYK